MAENPPAPAPGESTPTNPAPPLSQPVGSFSGGTVPDQTAAEAPDPGSPASEDVAAPYGSLGDRLIGTLVDWLVAFGVFFFLGMLIAPRFGGATATGFELNGAPALAVLVPVTLLLLAYFVLLEAGVGATLGKLVAGTQVRGTEGGRASLRAALIRNLMRLVDGIAVYLVAAITVLLTKRNQRLGDLVAGTVVVRRNRPRAVRIGALVAAGAFVVGGVIGGFAFRGPAPAAAPTGGAGGAVVSVAGVPRYASVMLTDQATGGTAKTEFPPNTAQVFVVFTLADVPPETGLRSVWIAENVVGAPPNTRIDEAELSAGGLRNQGNFSFSRPSAGWPAGSYRVELYLAGTLAETVRFTVPAAASPGAAGQTGGASPAPAGATRAPAGR